MTDEVQTYSPEKSLKSTLSVAVSKPSSESAEPKSPASSAVSTEMESLTELLGSSLKIEELATKASRNVVVPPGYRLSLEISASEFYKQKAIVVKDNKRKRDTGVFTVVPRRKYPTGFRPQDVQWHGALDLKDCKPSNLANDIHPLLRHSRFDDCPDYIYSALKPGLRLATMFLTQPICCQFWVLLMKGKRSFDLEFSRNLRTRCHRIVENVQMTNENTAEAIEYIKRLDDADMARWSFKPDLKFGDCPAYGVTQGVCDYQPEFTKGPINTVVRHNLRLHADFYIAASKYSTLGTNANTAPMLRFSFFLAVITCHELAHAIEGAHRRARRLGDDNFLEPWLFNHEFAELGRAWESMTFGGTIHPINSSVDGSHGIATWDWPEEVSGMSLKYTVSMAYIEKLFQMETWQQGYDLKDWKTFHVSRNGAVSINLNCLTTMPWSEEVRVAKEALEGSLANIESAAKKRETGKGGAVTSLERSRGVPLPVEKGLQEPIPRPTPGKNDAEGHFTTKSEKVIKRLKPKGEIPKIKKATAQGVGPSSGRFTRGRGTLKLQIKSRKGVNGVAAVTKPPKKKVAGRFKLIPPRRFGLSKLIAKPASSFKKASLPTLKRDIAVTAPRAETTKPVASENPKIDKESATTFQSS